MIKTKHYQPFFGFLHKLKNNKILLSYFSTSIRKR